ncbi:hypothetical protein AX15_006653 [Amanita polypyramis BW_CC]|nr:hypothetical protein AX15_006653 [Amanita polypyramis BW_CC]
MPKSAKKRKEKAADFTKQKLKLGKKQTPTNAVDTSFKARTITLPGQSITVEKGADAPTTKRKLTIDDLLIHLKHYNVATRRDAIFGLRELLESHWDLLESHLVLLLNGLVRLISDEDPSVRRTLTSFLAWLLPRIPSEELTPHSPLLILYATSAQTHIFPEIRIDAIRVLNVLLECIPESITSGCCRVNEGHGSRVLNGYLGILSAGTTRDGPEGLVQATSSASVVLSPASKLVVLQSLSSFLRAGLLLRHGESSPSRDAQEVSHFWFLLQAFRTPESYDAFDCLLKPTTQYTIPRTSSARLWTAEPGLNEDFVHHPNTTDFVMGDSWSLEDLSEERRGFDRSPSDEIIDTLNYEALARLAQNLQPTLVSTFLDCVPTVFSPRETLLETSLQLVLAVSQIAKNLYGVLLQRRSILVSGKYNGSIEDLGTMLGYMAPYFPFKSKGEQAFQELNVIFCELAALHKFAVDGDPRTPQNSAKRKQKPPSGHVHDALPNRATLVSEYIVRLLDREALSSTQLAHSVTPTAYLSLAPAIWLLLDSHAIGHAEQQYQVLNAVIDHSLKTPSKSATKRPSIEFVARLILLDTEPQYQGAFKSGRGTRIETRFEEWLLHLPQCLWELGAADLHMTEVILRTLLRLLQRKPRLFHTKILKNFGSKLAPYFNIDHAVRGQRPGPYTKLPLSSGLRMLALDVVGTLMMLSACQGAGSSIQLLVAVDHAVSSSHEQSYWAYHKLMLRGTAF